MFDAPFWLIAVSTVADLDPDYEAAEVVVRSSPWPLLIPIGIAIILMVVAFRRLFRSPEQTLHDALTHDLCVAHRLSGQHQATLRRLTGATSCHHAADLFLSTAMYDRWVRDAQIRQGHLLPNARAIASLRNAIFRT